MRLQFFLDTDPTGSGRRARWWAIILAFVAIILAELAFLGFIITAVAQAR